MNQEQQRIAIAEACGYSWVTKLGSNTTHHIAKYTEADLVSLLESGFILGKQGEAKAKDTYGEDYVPDYLNDLNAMHEAEKMLTSEQCNLYNNYLCDVKRPYSKTLPQSERWTWGSSAEQRAEAFLKTLNLWIE